jgi:GNAT superfamily N-acetyltransferase
MGVNLLDMDLVASTNMLEFEFDSQVDTASLVEFFARCGWAEDDAGAKVEWALAAADDWVTCRLDGELIGFGRSCSIGPVSRIVFDVVVDSRYRGRGLGAEIVRLLTQNAGRFQEVSVYAKRAPFLADNMALPDDDDQSEIPWATLSTYLGKAQESSRAGRFGESCGLTKSGESRRPGASHL